MLDLIKRIIHNPISGNKEINMTLKTDLVEAKLRSKQGRYFRIKFETNQGEEREYLGKVQDMREKAGPYSNLVIMQLAGIPKEAAVYKSFYTDRVLELT
jgi:hypothetical protein